MKDTIEKKILIKASREEIYDAIANAEKVVKWFPDSVEGKYEKGEQPIFGFGEHGKNQVYIVDAKPHEYFAYRWIPGSNHFTGDLLKQKTTLVEFRIEEEKEGICRVTMTESGFASLPADVIEKSFQQNTEGWEFMLGRFEKYFQAA